MVVSVAKWTASAVSPTSIRTEGAPECVISRSAWLNVVPDAAVNRPRCEMLARLHCGSCLGDLLYY